MARYYWMPVFLLCLLSLLLACGTTPPPSADESPRVPVVDTSVVTSLRGMPLRLPTAVTEATVAAVEPPAEASPATDNLVMARSAVYRPTINWPLPTPTQQIDIQAGWLAPLYPPDADPQAVRDRLIDALSGAGYGGRWEELAAPGQGLFLVTPVERLPMREGQRWASRDDQHPGERYRMFVFQLGTGNSPLGRVFVYEAHHPAATLAGFVAASSASAVEHLQQAGILRSREVLVLASNHAH